MRYCKDLTELYLYSNQISVIEGLEGLTKLTKLWLNGNRITTIQVSLIIAIEDEEYPLGCVQGLDALKDLRDLNLSGNAIESIGHSLDSLSHLEVLRLSGNRLTSLQVFILSLYMHCYCSCL